MKRGFDAFVPPPESEEAFRARRAADMQACGLDPQIVDELQRRANRLDAAAREARYAVDQARTADESREKALRSQAHGLTGFVRGLPVVPALTGLDATPAELVAVEALRTLHGLAEVAGRMFAEADRLRAIPLAEAGTPEQREAVRAAIRASNDAADELSALLAPLRALERKRAQEAEDREPRTLAAIARSQGIR